MRTFDLAIVFLSGVIFSAQMSAMIYGPFDGYEFSEFDILFSVFTALLFGYFSLEGESNE